MSTLPFVAYFGHHKCGTEWITAILRAVCARAGLSLFRSDSERPFDGDIVAFHAQQPFDFWCYTNADFSFVHNLDVRGFNVVRDPRDMVVSAYFSHLRSHPTEGWPRLRAYRAYLQQLPTSEGLLSEMEFIGPIFATMLMWRPLPGVRQVRFEDLIGAPEDLFVELLTELRVVGDAIAADDVREIVRQHAFERLSGGRRAGEENTSHHFRKGVPGDWRNHFTAEHVAYFKKLYNVLLLRLGYEQDGDWDLAPARPRAG